MTYRNPGMSRVGRAPLLAFVFLVALPLSIPALVLGAEDSHKISWRTDLGQAQAEAKSRDLLLWIQFTGPWCGNCRRMEKAAFAHAPVVAEAQDRFVPVKLRADEYESLTAESGPERAALDGDRSSQRRGG